MQVLHIVGLERDGTEEEGKQDDTRAPQVSLESLVALVPDDLGSNIGWCTTLLEHEFALFDRLRDAKVSNLDVTLSIQKDVVQFDVSVQDFLRVNVADSFYNLLEEHLGQWLIQLLPLSHEVQQIASCAELHDEHDVPSRLESLIQLDDRVVPQFEQDTDLVHDLGPLLLLRQVLLVDRFDSDQLSRKLVHTQVHFTESTSPKHLARSVELSGSLRRIILLLE